MDAVADRLFVGTIDDAKNTIQLRDTTVAESYGVLGVVDRADK